MTIDEAIKQIEEIVEDNQRIVDTHRFSDVLTIEEAYCDDTEIIEERLAVYQKRADDFRQLAEWLKELKELREQTRWAPVSEKLPEEEGDFLLWGKVCEDEDEYPFIGSYDSGCEQFGIWQEQFDRTTLGCLGSEFFEYASVIAWQPLPEPFEDKKESEE